MVTVKKDQTIKLALHSKLLNQAIHKNKYQKPKIDTFIKSKSQQISAPASQNATYFSTLDLKYAYSQLNFDPNTANHSNFNIISGEMTGTYRFQTEFYSLTDMRVHFQKAMDYTLIGLKNTYCFLNDISIVSKESEEEHKQYVLNCLVISPLESKTSAILALEAPTTLGKLRSFLGSVDYITKFIPNLAQVSHPLRSLLKNRLN